jgi:hypothetical protein
MNTPSNSAVALLPPLSGSGLPEWIKTLTLEQLHAARDVIDADDARRAEDIHRIANICPDCDGVGELGDEGSCYHCPRCQGAGAYVPNIEDHANKVTAAKAALEAAGYPAGTPRNEIRKEHWHLIAELDHAINAASDAGVDALTTALIAKKLEAHRWDLSVLTPAERAHLSRP